MHFVNVISIPMVAPFGGRQARFVTNPIAMGVPRAGQPPLLLDFATSKIAVGKARVALNEGKQVPLDSLLDRDGEPSRNPADLFNTPRGALLPFGDHKGSGLALMCEILGAALIGGPVMTAAPASRRIINNMLTIAIDPAFFAEHGAMDESITQLIEWARGSKPIDAAKGILFAGEPELASRQRRAKGIPIDANTWAELENAANLVGMGAQRWSEIAKPQSQQH